MTIFIENLEKDFRCKECGGHVIGEYPGHCPAHIESGVVWSPVNIAAALGRRGRAKNTAAQQAAAREAGKKGGRPRLYHRYIVINDECYPVNTEDERKEALTAMHAVGISEAAVWSAPVDAPNSPDAVKTSAKILAQRRTQGCINEKQSRAD